MFLGVAGLVGFGVILGPIAVGLGVIARTEIRRERATGRSARPIAGIVLGVVAFVVPIVLAVT